MGGWAVCLWLGVIAMGVLVFLAFVGDSLAFHRKRLKALEKESHRQYEKRQESAAIIVKPADSESEVAA